MIWEVLCVFIESIMKENFCIKVLSNGVWIVLWEVSLKKKGR